MIGVVIIAVKIILKNGKDMSRELLGVNFQSTEPLPNDSIAGETISWSAFFTTKSGQS